MSNNIDPVVARAIMIDFDHPILFLPVLVIEHEAK
jgi:hypothetical protein